jgi:hypothetical protein
MWGCVKDPLDAPLTFDRDGLDLAFKYFSSSTLTMRLAGIAHINAHINMFNELCNSDSVAEVESVGQSLANWLVDNNIIAHIFGPNLHVEVNYITGISVLWQQNLVPELCRNVQFHMRELRYEVLPRKHRYVLSSILCKICTLPPV